MTAENQKKYDAKFKRMNDALSLKEPDMVPIDVEGGSFAIRYAGYTVKDCIYDTSLEIYKEAMVKYMKDFDPDVVSKSGAGFYGEGPGFEATQPKNMVLPGMKGAKIDDNSLQQHIERPTLLDDEFDEFFTDRTGWRIHKFLPRISGLLESFENLNLSFENRASTQIACEFAKPEIRETVLKLIEIGDFYNEQRRKSQAIVKDLIDMGYPDFGGGGGMEVPFDNWSDNFRGTILSLEDIYVNRDEVIRYMDEFHAKQLKKIAGFNKTGRATGKFCSDPLHKGIDGFMSDEVYEEFYWKYLYEMQEAAIKAGMIPMLFCEGAYNTRLKFLKKSPEGRKLFRFETIDMKLAKKELKGVACIGGGFPSQLLQFGTKQQVADKVKELLDDAMPGGGYIFRPSAGLDGAKFENVEVMFQTVREYGKY